MELGLSTCLFAGKGYSGFEIIDICDRLGISCLECEYRLSSKAFYEIQTRTKSSNIKVKTLHNICYRPDYIPEEKADADYYNLASPDDNERKDAVEHLCHTIRCAAEIGAGHVILHLGDTGQEKMRDRFRYFTDNDLLETPAGMQFFRDYTAEREKRSAATFPNALKSLSEIIPRAEKEGISIGVENRYYIYQHPSFEEFFRLFREFNGAPVGLWLDTGHGHVKGLWGRGGIEDYLETFGDKLMGFHIHDAAGRHDHRPPGQGEIDFYTLSPFLKKDTVRILEINRRHSVDEVRKGKEYLQKVIT